MQSARKQKVGEHMKSRGLRLLGFWLCLIAMAAAAQDRALQFVAREISDPAFENREPVISETGLAVWTAYIRATEGDEGASEIHVWKNGERRSVTAGSVPAGTTHYRPTVYADSAAWIGAYPGGGEENWVLREVPGDQRDVPHPELVAFGTVVTEEKPLESQEQPPPESGETPPEASAPEQRPMEPDAARRHPSGYMEVVYWKDNNVQRVTYDARNDFGVSLWDGTLAWQKAKGFPFGWEIMVWRDGTMYQLTTNFYYDMGPQVQGSHVVWYGWDGNDYEIYMHDFAQGITFVVTSNRYDDVSPRVWNGVVVWEAYPGPDGEIFMWSEGRFQRISDNSWDDLNPRIWDGKVVWQGYDGDDFEIYYFDGTRVIKLTSNRYDDINPDIRDGLICWMAYYENNDAEIFAWDIEKRDYVELVVGDQVGATPGRLSYNDVDDRAPRTANRRVIWEARTDQGWQIFLAEPRR